MSHQDTIAAIATAPGQGGIGIIRVSGEMVPAIAESFLNKAPQARYAHYTSFKDADGDAIDQGILLYFEAPASFTGEHVIELQIHGGPIVLDRLLAEVLSKGCRPARAGEFSERAFMNDRIDLVQAEAIADLISAESEQSARAAMHSLQGDFSKKINELLQHLTTLRVHVESALDFPEEEIDFLADKAILEQLVTVQQSVEQIHISSKQGKLLREGLNTVITGRPNAGKSSLLNALAGFDSAIVSDMPGTTRDVIREHVQLEGIPLHIVDTAGMRDSDDAIEQEGVKRALSEIERADIVIRVVDVTAEDDGEAIDNEILVYNKIDLKGTHARRDGNVIYMSAHNGDGMVLLKECILDSVGYDASVQQEGLFTARQRHVDAINKLKQHLDTAAAALSSKNGEILAEELRLAQNLLAEVTGEFTPDDLLGKIFSEFCIGK